MSGTEDRRKAFDEWWESTGKYLVYSDMATSDKIWCVFRDGWDAGAMRQAFHDASIQCGGLGMPGAQ